MMALASVWSYALLHWAKEFTGLRLGCTQGWSQGIRQPPWQFLVWLLCPISAASKHDVFLLSGVRVSYHLLLVSPAFQPVQGAHLPTYQKLQNPSISSSRLDGLIMGLGHPEHQREPELFCLQAMFEALLTRFDQCSQATEDVCACGSGGCITCVTAGIVGP